MTQYQHLSSNLIDYEWLGLLNPQAKSDTAQLYLARHLPSQTCVVIKMTAISKKNPAWPLLQHEIHVMHQLNAQAKQIAWMPLLASGSDFFMLKAKRERVGYYVMPYLEYPTLKQALPLPAQTDVKTLMMNLVGGLQAIHQANWLHLDIKPSNIFMSLQPIYADFALAQALPYQQQGYDTQGTPKYMSPEQFLGQPLSKQTDYYALGLVFFELLTNQSPFNAHRYHEWAVQHCQQPVPLLPASLAALQPLIDGLLAKQLTTRFQAAEEIVQAIILDC